MLSIFIPIKKISKRVKNKNTKRIKKFKFGLTEIKIIQLLKLRRKISKNYPKLKMEFVISSDDLRLKEYIKNYKLFKFHKRPKELAKDDCLPKLIKEVPKICNGKYILWTHVTSPFFDENSYFEFIKIFFKKKLSYDSAFTADLIRSFIYNLDKQKWISHSRKKNKWPRTQDLDKIYKINSAAFIAKRKVYTSYNDRVGLKPFPVICNKKKNETFDIDTNSDFNYFKKQI